MNQIQPNQTLLNSADDLERLADRAAPLMTARSDAPVTLVSEKLCAIHDLFDAAHQRLRALQERHPDIFRYVPQRGLNAAH